MGEGILQFYQKEVKREYKVAFLASFFTTLLIHLYKFANTLPNHDSLYNYYADQNIVGSGRWALSLACGISSYYDLPWVIGLLSCLFIALTVVVIAALFQLKNPILIALVGALLAAAPATTETFFFLYTADGYMIAMFLAALAVYFSRIDETRISRWIISGACICVSCGIYQAYVSFALLLAVCYFMDVLLQNKHSKSDCTKWVLRQAVIYAVSLAAYYVIWKLCMKLQGVSANSYLGISSVGTISLDLLRNGLFSSVETMKFYFLQGDLLQYGFSLYSALNIVFVVLFIAALAISVVKSGILQRKWALLLLALCLIAIVPFACIWHFTSAFVEYRAMMLQSLTLLFVFTALLYERWTSPLVKNAVGLFLLVVVLNHALMANISYFYMNQCYERSYAEALEMMTDIRRYQSEYGVEKVAIVGVRRAELLLETTDPETGELQPSGKIQILNGVLEKSFLYDSGRFRKFMQSTFGMELETPRRAERNALLHTEAVQSMTCWPNAGSMAIIDDTLVIKLSDIEE